MVIKVSMVIVADAAGTLTTFPRANQRAGHLKPVPSQADGFPHAPARAVCSPQRVWLIAAEGAKCWRVGARGVILRGRGMGAGGPTLTPQDNGYEVRSRVCLSLWGPVAGQSPSCLQRSPARPCTPSCLFIHPFPVQTHHFQPGPPEIAAQETACTSITGPGSAFVGIQTRKVNRLRACSCV